MWVLFVFFLGIGVAPSKLGISLYQQKFALDILKDIDMLVCTWNSLLGILIISCMQILKILLQFLLFIRTWWLVTKPDLTFALSMVSYFRHCHGPHTWRLFVKFWDTSNFILDWVYSAVSCLFCFTYAVYAALYCLTYFWWLHLLWL